jgi:Uncharacterized protein conserved in bacteria
LQIITVACIAIIFTASAITLYDSQRTITEKDFLIEVNLDRTVFYVGGNVSFTASIINRSGRDVNISSNTVQPGAWFYNIKDNVTYVEISPLRFDILKPNEKMSRDYNYSVTEPGTYILDVRYHIGVNNVEFENQLANITIEVR